MKKIVYCSNANHTKEYAEMISKKMNIEITSIDKIKNISKDDEIIYMGWVFASHIQGLEKIKNKYNIICIIAVGMNKNTKQNDKVLIETNKIEIPFFYLQGGLDYTRLKGIKKHMLKFVSKQVIKENKPENKELIDIFENGKNCVTENNLKDVYKFLEKNRKEK